MWIVHLLPVSLLMCCSCTSPHSRHCQLYFQSPLRLDLSLTFPLFSLFVCTSPCYLYKNGTVASYVAPAAVSRSHTATHRLSVLLLLECVLLHGFHIALRHLLGLLPSLSLTLQRFICSTLLFLKSFLLHDFHPALGLCGSFFLRSNVELNLGRRSSPLYHQSYLAVTSFDLVPHQLLSPLQHQPTRSRAHAAKRVGD